MEMALLALLTLLSTAFAMACLGFLAGRRHGEQERAVLTRQNADLRTHAAAQSARLSEAQRAIENEHATLNQAQAQLTQVFRALAADTLKGANEQFLALAQRELKSIAQRSDEQLSAREKGVESLVGPLREALQKLNEENNKLSEQRASDSATLRCQLLGVAQSHHTLQAETAKLVNALRAPQIKGRWGEIQLRRVAELAGMSTHCDFSEQQTVRFDEGLQRPDMIVQLPAGREVVVDSKVPLTHFLDALEATSDEAREAALTAHTKLVRSHVDRLASKDYWARFASAEFVVLFIPSDSFLSAAAERDPDLIEWALAKRVVLATPSTLIALLKAIAYGWRQERLQENAERISRLGRELHGRLAILSEHFASMGQKLGGTVRAYNAALGSLESRVLASARRLEELDAGSEKELSEISPVEELTRELN
jgi:DNA recombination protein RmuC